MAAMCSMQHKCSHCFMLAVIRLPSTTWAAAGVRSPTNTQHMLRMNYTQTFRQYMTGMHRYATSSNASWRLAGCVLWLQLRLTVYLQTL